MPRILTDRDFAFVTEVLELFDDFIEQMPAIFDRRVFKRLRQSSFSQWDWADAAHVAQGTIGNWERGITSPMGGYRSSLKIAAMLLRDEYEAKHTKKFAREDTLFDPLKTNEQLQQSILRAALTDFDLDAEGNKIVPVPFLTDQQSNDIDELEQDKTHLLNSLSSQIESIVEELQSGANVPTEKLVRYFERYRNAAVSERPNPRLLGSGCIDFRCAA